jgi:hypothetical protein
MALRAGRFFFGAKRLCDVRKRTIAAALAQASWRLCCFA